MLSISAFQGFAVNSNHCIPRLAPWANYAGLPGLVKIGSSAVCKPCSWINRCFRVIIIYQWHIFPSVWRTASIGFLFKVFVSSQSVLPIFPHPQKCCLPDCRPAAISSNSACWISGWCRSTSVGIPAAMRAGMLRVIKVVSLSTRGDRRSGHTFLSFYLLGRICVFFNGVQHSAPPLLKAGCLKFCKNGCLPETNDISVLSNSKRNTMLLTLFTILIIWHWRAIKKEAATWKQMK